MAKSRIIKRQRYYDYASFIDDQTGQVTLLIRDFAARLLPSGKIRVHRKRDVLTFDNEAGMVKAIYEQKMRSLPESVWGDRDYTPPAFQRERLASQCVCGETSTRNCPVHGNNEEETALATEARLRIKDCEDRNAYKRRADIADEAGSA